jgi:hypothetical protein
MDIILPVLDGIVPPVLIVVVSLVLAAVRHFYAGTRRAPMGDLAVVLTILSLAMVLEFEMGRTPTYKNGPVRLWSGDINSDQNSQQVFDPYSFTHVIHGAAFYGLTRLVLGAASFGPTAIAVITLEAAWEVYENTNQVINRYRAATISLGYDGDSMINSFFDMVACLFGLLLAWRRPAWITLSWVFVVEVSLALWIHDNLTLNIIMLLHPFKAIKAWQMGIFLALNPTTLTR